MCPSLRAQRRGWKRSRRRWSCCGGRTTITIQVNEQFLRFDSFSSVPYPFWWRCDKECWLTNGFFPLFLSFGSCSFPSTRYSHRPLHHLIFARPALPRHGAGKWWRGFSTDNMISPPSLSIAYHQPAQAVGLLGRLITYNILHPFCNNTLHFVPRINRTSFSPSYPIPFVCRNSTNPPRRWRASPSDRATRSCWSCTHCSSRRRSATTKPRSPACSIWRARPNGRRGLTGRAPARKRPWKRTSRWSRSYPRSTSKRTVALTKLPNG